MIKWIKNRLSQEAAAIEVEENFAPVGVRVKRPGSRTLKPADSCVAGYNVDDTEFGADDEHSSTMPHINTTGVDPYNTGAIDLSNVKKPVPEK